VRGDRTLLIPGEERGVDSPEAKKLSDGGGDSLIQVSGHFLCSVQRSQTLLPLSCSLLSPKPLPLYPAPQLIVIGSPDAPERRPDHPTGR